MSLNVVRGTFSIGALEVGSRDVPWGTICNLNNING